jgi:hypothetical protein
MASFALQERLKPSIGETVEYVDNKRSSWRNLLWEIVGLLQGVPKTGAKICENLF